MLNDTKFISEIDHLIWQEIQFEIKLLILDYNHVSNMQVHVFLYVLLV